MEVVCLDLREVCPKIGKRQPDVLRREGEVEESNLAV
jgi:hypothetical protein